MLSDLLMIPIIKVINTYGDMLSDIVMIHSINNFGDMLSDIVMI